MHIGNKHYPDINAKNIDQAINKLEELSTNFSERTISNINITAKNTQAQEVYNQAIKSYFKWQDGLSDEDFDASARGLLLAAQISEAEDDQLFKAYSYSEYAVIHEKNCLYDGY
ncbi:MAG: hypothetical protein KTR28_05850 [Micavibrio sp.]|nr:hypothetical protein [Micavibrio sp.]